MSNVSIVLIPSLLGSPRLYSEQLPALWQTDQVTVAAHQHDESMTAIASRILATAPSRFALAGLSMGGYVAFEIMRQAPERITHLALMDTSARPDTPEQSQRRRDQIALAKNGQFSDVVDQLSQLWVGETHPNRAPLRQLIAQMASETGPDAFARQQQAIINRTDSRPGLAAITCPTLVLVGSDDELTPQAHAVEMSSGIPNSQLVVVPDCGHLSAIEQPQAVTQALLQLLQH
ncbi:alpha/beta fold hydrolase [Actinoplanes sp. GCM10030250]|uniref:alpha/beta fold hydrolase n=1 Tax=Actinoplanes sp. GCM10030250 TaxID=3273376 RepID=UPI003609C4F1